MANPLPPPPQPQSSAALLLLLLLTTSVAGAFNSTDIQELSSALESLRTHGYTLFTNAVTTSDLQYELLTTAGEQQNRLASFTLFAPKDEMLFALDMATDAAVYVNALRYHIVPNRRHAFADLQNLSSPYLDTLLPHFAILVAKIQNDDVFSEAETLTVMVDGVRVSDPDIFLGSRLAVHGIEGILLSGLNTSQDSDGRSDTLPTAESISPAPVRNIPAEEMFRFDWNNAPPAPVSEFDRDNSAPAPAEGEFSVEETPPASQFDRDYSTPAPAAGEIPVKASPKTNMQDQLEKLKNLAKKKREKHHVKGRRRHHHHRRHGAHADHVVNEL